MNELIVVKETDSQCMSNAGYAFIPSSNKWQISKDNHLYLSWAYEFLNETLRASFLKVIQYYVENYSAGHANNLSDRFREFARYIFNSRGVIQTITSRDLINYRSTLNREHEWYLASIRGFLRTWIGLSYFGLEESIDDLLDGWKLRGNIKGRAVQTLCPKEGPLSDLEFEALHQGLVDAFEKDTINIEDFSVAQLFMATGRRPSQIADLKAKDLVVAKSKDGLKEFILNVPRRKQRGIGWRQQFKPFALTKDVGALIEAIIEQNKARLSRLLGDVKNSQYHDLPIFPRWNVIEDLAKYGSNLELEIQTPALHRVTDDLRLSLDKVISVLNITSERTGDILNIFPTRLRRTLATRAAREGFGELVIAELLDHTDTQNAKVYTENVPEHVDAINEAIARQLAPLAQAFAGMVVKREQDAIRGNDLSSRVKCETGSVGTCGHYGFCGALAPIACYTCKNFQPWIDGPHSEVLASLLKERERISELTQDKAIASINDRTILAVTQVIQICESRQKTIKLELING